MITIDELKVQLDNKSRLLGVDRLNLTAKKFGLGEVVLGNYFNEKKGIVPSTRWKKKSNWAELVLRRNFN